MTPDGRWLVPQYSAGEKDLLFQLDEAGVDKAVLVSLPGLSPNEFVLEVCRRHPGRLLPVGSFNPMAYSAGGIADGAKKKLMDRGFIGVKLHPRMGRFDLLDPQVGHFLDEVAGWANPPRIWICTFLHYKGGKLAKSPVETLHEIVGRYPGITFILAHAGGPDILRMANAIRDCPNAFLDLSWTLTKYRGSSVETDIRYLVNTFEARMLFGSDFPETRISEAVASLETICRTSKLGACKAVFADTMCHVLGGTNIL